MRDRKVDAKKKAVSFYRECREMMREGPAYFVFFAFLIVVGTPFLLIDLLIFLLTGKDVGWFPASGIQSAADAPVVTTDEIIARMEPLKRPALHLVGTNRDVRSRIGGAPDLPENFQWPQWNDEPLAFLVQIDLAEIGRQSVLPDLPVNGLLYFFYDQEQSTWGFDPADKGSWKVFHSDSAARLKRTDPPAGLLQHGRFGEKRIEFRTVTTYPGIDRISEQVLNMSDETWDEVDELQARDFAGLPRHQLGGLPNPVQNDDMERECQFASNGINVGGPEGYASPEAKALEAGAADWVLLLQLDTDDDIGMMWGDVGTLYFWIREQDLKAGEFSRCWMVLQCS